MSRSRRVQLGKIAAAVAVVPVLLYAYAEGPDAGLAGVPGESTCAACHGSAGGSGSVTVTFPAGLTYAPGVKQHLVVTVSDPVKVGTILP